MSETKTADPKILSLQWRIPADLARLIRLEAAEQGDRPSAIVVARLRESFDRKPVAAATN